MERRQFCLLFRRLAVGRRVLFWELSDAHMLMIMKL
jgi:hypothetical protein